MNIISMDTIIVLVGAMLLTLSVLYFIREVVYYGSVIRRRTVKRGSRKSDEYPTNWDEPAK